MNFQTPRIKVLHINFSDLAGGAEEFASSLSSHQDESTLLVKHKNLDSKQIVELPRSRASKLFEFLSKVLWKCGLKTSFRNLLGRQDQFHSTYQILNGLTLYQSANIIHLHNIHGEYFDLDAVLKISRKKPIIWTLHDMWLTTGGEGHVYPGITQKDRKHSYPLREGALFDRRRANLAKKIRLVQQCQNIVYVTPSESHTRTIKATHDSIHPICIYYGVDTEIFFPRRRNLGQKVNVLIYNTSNHYKNSAEVIQALSALESSYDLHVLGEPLQLTKKGVEVTNYGHINDRKEIASLFQKMDLAAISSKVESFGLLPLEIAACGVRVLLNASLPVFHEHAALYGAELFENSEHLCSLIKNDISNPKETLAKGIASADKIKENLSRSATFKSYQELYQKVLKIN